MDSYEAYKISIRANKRLNGNPHDYVGAREDLDRLILFFPDEHGAYVHRARLNFYEHKYMDSIADWTHVIRLNPDNGDGNYDRGIVYQTIGHHSEALRDYAKALELFELFPGLSHDSVRIDTLARMEQIKSQS